MLGLRQTLGLLVAIPAVVLGCVIWFKPEWAGPIAEAIYQKGFVAFESFEGTDIDWRPGEGDDSEFPLLRNWEAQHVKHVGRIQFPSGTASLKTQVDTVKTDSEHTFVLTLLEGQTLRALVDQELIIRIYSPSGNRIAGSLGKGRSAVSIAKLPSSGDYIIALGNNSEHDLAYSLSVSAE